MILKTNIAASSISNDNGIPDAEEYIGQKVLILWEKFLFHDKIIIQLIF